MSALAPYTYTQPTPPGAKKKTCLRQDTLRKRLALAQRSSSGRTSLSNLRSRPMTRFEHARTLRGSYCPDPRPRPRCRGRRHRIIRHLTQ